MSTVEKANFKRAKQAALDVLRKYDIEAPIVPVFELVRREDIEISRFSSSTDNLAKISGFLIKDSDNKVCIFLNSDDTPQRQLFTVAHEYGHYKLKHDHSEILYRYSTPIDKDPFEQEANCFAANLLVPEYMLKSVMKEYSLSKFDVSLLSKLFGVSEDVIKFRLQWI